MTANNATNAIYEAGHFIRRAYEALHPVAYDRKGGLNAEELREIRDVLRFSVSDELARVDRVLAAIYTLDPWEEN